MTLATLEQYTRELVKDEDDRLENSDFTSAIRAAVNKFSSVKPLQRVYDIEADGTIRLPLPETWDSGFSKVNWIERDLDAFPPDVMASDEYGVFPTPNGDELRLAERFDNGHMVRVGITTQHQVTDDSSTIHETDLDAVSLWAASRLLDTLAALYSGDSDSTISADSVDHNDKARQYAARAKNYRQQFYHELGIDPKRNIAAGAVVDFDSKDSQGNGRLQHKERFR